MARHPKTGKWSLMEDRVPANTCLELDRAVVGATLTFMQEPHVWTRASNNEITDVAFNAIMHLGSLLDDDTLKTTTMNKKHKQILKEGISELNLQDKALEHCMSTEPAVIADTSTKVFAVVTTPFLTTASAWSNTVVHEVKYGNAMITAQEIKRIENAFSTTKPSLPIS